MNWFESLLYKLQATTETPKPYGTFHLACLGITLISILILYLIRKKHNDMQLKIILGSYGVVALILEVLKQLIWTFEYDTATSLVRWDYSWYAAPFQLCTTPIYVSLICFFLKKNKVRDALLSYLAFYTILGSIMTMVIPESCFTEDILVNIHTMFLHCGSFAVSVYILLSKEIKIEFKNLLRGLFIFLLFASIANILNISFYKSGIIGDETFNMFYISPYFISDLPIYDTIQEKVPYIIYLIIYTLSIHYLYS